MVPKKFSIILISKQVRNTGPNGDVDLLCPIKNAPKSYTFWGSLKFRNFFIGVILVFHQQPEAFAMYIDDFQAWIIL